MSWRSVSYRYKAISGANSAWQNAGTNKEQIGRGRCLYLCSIFLLTRERTIFGMLLIHQISKLCSRSVRLVGTLSIWIIKGMYFQQQVVFLLLFSRTFVLEIIMLILIVRDVLKMSRSQ
jgi:hypothetical protein